MLHAEIIDANDQLVELASEWNELALRLGAPVSLGIAWVRAYLSAFLSRERLYLVTVRRSAGGELVALWPLSLSAPGGRRLPIDSLQLGELHAIGDVGGVQRSVLCVGGEEERAAEAMVAVLAERGGWHLLEAPVSSRRLVDALELAIGRRGGTLQRAEIYGRPYLELPTEDRLAELVQLVQPDWQSGESRYEWGTGEPALNELMRLCRRQWAEDAAVAAPELEKFLAELLPALEPQHQSRIDLIRAPNHAVVAASLVICDRDRHIELLRAIDPGANAKAAEQELVLATLRQTVRSGCRRFEFADDEAPLKSARTRISRVRMWNDSTLGILRRSVEWLGRSRADRPTTLGRAANPQWSRVGAGWRALDKLQRPLPPSVRKAVARVANHVTLHLYRGELFVSSPPSPGLQLRVFLQKDFDALEVIQRETLLDRLTLDARYCVEKWQRGDCAVLAERDGSPAGIGWFSRGSTYVPDIEREVRPATGESYIFDLFVNPEERGRGVAPAMLNFLSQELRRRDVYRAWALIERTNTASTRAFERAGYASVADVVYEKMGLTTRLLIRPPDPEAQRLFGVEVAR